ncbi:MAG: inositol monophosphatase, partial [Candidatus Diapherotrites archaeon]|nr:inositol monophosphatase [Candidatus Diapherotrites archaeon]
TALQYFGKPLRVKTKSARLGIVTDADIACQNRIKEIISSSFPDDLFFAEEDKQNPKPRGRVWVIDPIDGTNNFSRGIPFFCVSIAFWEGNIKSGVVHVPALGYTFTSEKGKGAFFNGKKMHVSGVSRLKDGFADIGMPRREGIREKGFKIFSKIYPKGTGFKHFGTAALQLSFVAVGWLDAYLEFGLYPWDVAAGILVLQESGGKVTDDKGKGLDFFKNDFLIVASNGKVHSELLEALK